MITETVEVIKADGTKATVKLAVVAVAKTPQPAQETNGDVDGQSSEGTSTSN